MRETVPVSVGIPTWARGKRVLDVLQRLHACDPRPAETIVHVDAGDGELERVLSIRFPAVRLLSSRERVGPGGGRHRCIRAARNPFFVSFDDDSWPLDLDFFSEVVRIFASSPDVALCAATITHPWEEVALRREVVEPVVEFTGCGWAVRRESYLRCPGFVDRPLAYGVEESDLGLQMFGRGMRMVRSENLRVFHDTRLSHHRRPEQAAAAIQNVALLAWLRYPARLLPWATLQVANMALDQLRRGRGRGVFPGLVGIPGVMRRWRFARDPLPAAAVRAYLNRRKRPAAFAGTAVLHAPAASAN